MDGWQLPLPTDRSRVVRLAGGPAVAMEIRRRQARSTRGDSFPPPTTE